ncbi:MAG: DUF1549 and DUF1553 domain-containing protein [Phycisphaeraceae bacterium]
MKLLKFAPCICSMLLAALFTPPHEVSAAAANAVEEPKLKSSDYQHWSFIPPSRPALPQVKDKAWPRNPIDHFILAELESKNLQPMPQAGPRTLIRRVTFDLTGLPPTAEEVEAFVREWEGQGPWAKGQGNNPQSAIRDPQFSAYLRLIDRLLASPAYGERWAQHWLDVARFAETDGFEHDKVRPEAWKYRDWVITALNEDMPYDRFVRSQLAGDELGQGHDSVATGFLMAGPDFPDINSQDERREAKLNEITSTVSQAILGLTIGCARCHDHKYDPISQADHYRLRAVFANILHPKKDKLFDTTVREPSATAPQSFVMIRGEYDKLGPKIEAGFPRVINRGGTTIAPPAKEAKSSLRRAVLADWITQPDNPMTARVMVNRLWLHHFGVGLVKTPGDFGFMGDSPTHPQLLDWLAMEFAEGEGQGNRAKGQEVESNPQSAIRDPQSSAWSLKRMHRLMLTSATYMQASRPADESWNDELQALASSRWATNKRIDPTNRNYWHTNRRRLEGEAIRDAMLLVSGKLNAAQGGEGVFPPLPPEVTANLLAGQWKVSPNEADHYRRSIYIFARRNLRFPLFEVFDKPDTNAVCPQRPRSTTATQSLTLLNSPFSLEMAQALAGRAMKASPDDINASIAFSFAHTLGRAPTPVELSRCLAFIESQAASLREAGRKPKQLALPEPMPEKADAHQAAAIVDLCLSLFNLSEFVYVD